MRDDNYSKTALDLLLILFITAVIYLPFLGLPPWGGNEPLRVVAAQEILKSGNWTAPMLHGRLYFLKPPLMNWLIAANGYIFGAVNEWTSRLPSVFITFAMGVSVYLLCKNWLGRAGRFFAAVATVSMVGLISKGVTAEIDSFFIFFVVISLLIWMNGYSRQWRPIILWGISLSLLAVGFLTKGPQVIAYFYLTVFAYLLLKRRARFFFSLSHLAGLCLFLLILGSYLLAILRWIPFNDYIDIWSDQIMQRAEGKHHLAFFTHAVSYPFIMTFQFMPWVLFIIPVFYLKGLRKKANGIFKNEIFSYSLVMLAVNFPIYWLLPSAMARYFLPACPFVAIATGVFFEFYLREARDNPEISVFFKKALKLLLWAALFFALMLLPVVLFMKLKPSMSLIMVIISLISLIIVTGYRINSIKLLHVPVYVALITGLFFLAYTYIDTRYNLEKVYNPRTIAQEIDAVLKGDINTVYEIGYNKQLLRVTSYLRKGVIQVENPAKLKSIDNKNNKTYFVFYVRLGDQTLFLQDIAWEKIYSTPIGSKGEIVVGRLM
ncbi:MAG: glycosyltransferase family 39 protein [Thermodesulfovibrionales bacterium]|nr:glycosyltransferase family 39 protein [Thermodesulfovibrionales bacterium]